MEYAHLGRSGLTVSRLCLGTMNFGPLAPPGDAHAIMDQAHELGIDFFDTANTYGRRQSPPGQVAGNDASHAGWTEEILGDWFARGVGRREKTVLAAAEAHRERIEGWEEPCGKPGEEPAHVALAWLLQADGVTAPVIGPRTLDSAQRALEITLDPGALARIGEIFPGYKTAPGRYAWQPYPSGG